MKQTIPESQVTQRLEEILEKHHHERVCVVGTTCTGKSYLIKHIPYAQDMDDLIFPQLSTEEEAHVMGKPWTEEIGKTMTRLVKERVKIEPGKPVFGTVIIESDYLIYLKISDALLRERTKTFFRKYNTIFKSKKIKSKILFNESSRDYVREMEEENKSKYDKRFLPKTTPTELSVAADYTAIIMLKQEPVVILIKDKETAESFSVYFKELWKVAKR